MGYPSTSYPTRCSSLEHRSGRQCAWLEKIQRSGSRTKNGCVEADGNAHHKVASLVDWWRLQWYCQHELADQLVASDESGASVLTYCARRLYSTRSLFSSNKQTTKHPIGKSGYIYICIIYYIYAGQWEMARWGCRPCGWLLEVPRSWKRQNGTSSCLNATTSRGFDHS